MTEYKSVAGYIQPDGEVIYALSEEILSDEQINHLAQTKFGSKVAGGYWIIHPEHPRVGWTGINVLCDRLSDAIARNPHWLILESGESEEKEKL